MNKNGRLVLRASKANDNRAMLEAFVGDRVVACDVIDTRIASDRELFAQRVHDAVPALEVSAIHNELLLIDRENLPTVDGADEAWSAPISIDRPVVPAFPLHVLPEPLRSWVLATAEATQTPSDLAGLLGLAVCAGAVARRIEILPGRGWREPINLYVACLLEPANRKSAVFTAAMRPLRSIERELMDLASVDVARLAADRRMREKELANLEKKGASGCDASREAAMTLAEELAGEPVAVHPKLLVDDATAEAIEIQLAAQGGRLVVAGCEGGLFDVMAGRYSSGVANLDCFLKGHAGDDLRVDRVTRAPLAIDRCCLTLAYAVQPDVIRGLASKPSFRGRGLIGRFMYSVPVSRLGKRIIDPAPVTEQITFQYEQLVRRLAAIRGEDDGTPPLLRLSSGAANCFVAWQQEVERWLGDDGRLVELRDWGGKLCGLTARLAAILHLISLDVAEPSSVPVEADVMRAAIELGRWAVPHAEAVIGLMASGSGPLDDGSYLLRWLRDRHLPEFSRRDAGQHGRSRFDGDPKRLDDALELLCDRGWIRPVVEPKAGVGRTSKRFAVHPQVCDLNSASPSTHTQNPQNPSSEYFEDTSEQVEISTVRHRGVI